jgi:hypothetical protein
MVPGQISSIEQTVPGPGNGVAEPAGGVLTLDSSLSSDAVEAATLLICRHGSYYSSERAR